MSECTLAVHRKRALRCAHVGGAFVALFPRSVEWRHLEEQSGAKVSTTRTDAAAHAEHVRLFEDLRDVLNGDRAAAMDVLGAWMARVRESRSEHRSSHRITV